jgi:L-ascorbate 6-phosphate lactonase
MLNVLDSIEKREVQRGIVLWWLGGSSWVLKTSEACVYVDLFTGPAPTETLTPITRDKPDLIDPNDISDIDFMLSTHYHVDHCHRESLTPIYKNTNANFIGPVSSTKLFKEWGFSEERIVEIEPYQKIQDKRLTITAVPLQDVDDQFAVGYLFETAEVNLLDAGDTLYFDGLKDYGEKWEIDIALLNYFTNLPELDMKLSMTPSEVAQAAIDLKAKILIPKHWDIWTEMLADPKELDQHLSGSGIELKVLEAGKEFVYHT